MRGMGIVWGGNSNLFVSVLYMAVFILLTHIVVVRGVREGIEKFSKIMNFGQTLLLLVFCTIYHLNQSQMQL